MTNPTRRLFLLTLCACVLLLVSCWSFGSKTPLSATLSPLSTFANQSAGTATDSIPSTEELSYPGVIPTLKSSPTPPPIQAPTLTATTGPEDALAQRATALIESDDWPISGIDPAHASAWEAFALREKALTGKDMLALQKFLVTWEMLKSAANLGTTPHGAEVVLHVDQRQDSDAQLQPVLYATVGDENLSSNETQLFLIASDSAGNAVGLVAAPIIEGLTQQIGPDGRQVEYIDPKKNRILMLADARKLIPSQQTDHILKQRLDEVYRKNHPYAQSGMYPRYYFPYDGISAGFYLVEKSLTFQQILQMNEAFALFDRPAMKPLKREFFGGNVSVVIMDQMDLASGLTYSGTGVIELDRRDLFGNKYYLAEVLAHEGSHVIQGRMNHGDGCKEVMQREVGSYTIPRDFLTWSADDLIEGVRDHTIGAYHVSMWVLNQIGVRGDELNLLGKVIQTGQVNGFSVTPFCKD